MASYLLTGACPVEIIWPTASGWRRQTCWAVGEHNVHTDDNCAPLCTTAEAAWMAEQHRLITDGLGDHVQMHELLVRINLGVNPGCGHPVCPLYIRRRTWPGAIA